MENNKILEFALTAGKILLENGAEAYRVEDTIMRIFKSFGIENCSVFVTTTGLFACIGSNTKMIRVSSRCINLTKVADINDLSRCLVEKRVNLDEAIVRLDEISTKLGYSNFVTSVCAGGTCALFVLLFGGTYSDGLSSFIVGSLLNYLNIYLISRNVTNFIATLLGGIFIALASLVNLNLGLGNDLDMVIIGAVMPLVPGMCFTTAVRDIFAGDYISGSSRIFEAIVIAVAIALGVGIVLSGWLKYFGSFFIF